MGIADGRVFVRLTRSIEGGAKGQLKPGRS